MRATTTASLTLLVALTLLANASVEAGDVALPADVKVVAPGADLPESYRRWSGAWRGKWAAELDHVLVVEQASPTGESSVVYAWSDSEKWRVKRGWYRSGARINGEKLILDRLPNSAEVEYTIEGADTVSGDFWRNRYLTEGTFQKFALPSAN